MKRALFSCTALAGVVFNASAFAADLPSRKAPPAYEPPAPVFTWTGFHVGTNHGFGGGVLDANVNLAGLVLTTTQTSNRANGVIAGGQAGYDFQFANNFVVGVETDIQWTDIEMSHQATTSSSAGPAGYTYADLHNGLDWFGTTRLRLGYSFGRLLPYVTGGVAYGGIEARGTQFVGGALFLGSASDTKVGWTAGAGAEYALTDNLSARLEYLYVQLPGVAGPAFGLTPPPFPPLAGAFSTGSFGTHLVRTGINLKFGGFGLPSADGILALLTAPPALDWSGFYVGVNGGYGGDVNDAVMTLASPAVAWTTRARNHSGGFIAGGQVGYNYQLGKHVVLGLETDGQWSDVKASHYAATAPAGLAITDTSNGLAWFGTTRVRAGWATGSTLAYLTGGVAYGDVDVRGTQLSGGLFWGSASRTKVGWTAGVGAEYALANNLSLKAEYLYLDLGEVSGPAFGVAPPPFAPFVGSFSTGAFGAHVTRVGLNWRFSGQSAAPVVAKY